MMKVSVKFYAHLRDLVDRKSKIEFDFKEGATISHLLDELFLDSKIKKHLSDEHGHLNSDITILRNGREIKFLNGIETLLESGDEISIFPLVAGG
ncbi:MoaD family protein [Candidatus Thorarchaeota archaeon]|nr:MoaD family protein [Candidatus Thorarchaeota archaeon]TFG97786.1 MAG: MoaD family protein [Candidatus Thorarchaeota archaeon]